MKDICLYYGSNLSENKKEPPSDWDRALICTRSTLIISWSTINDNMNNHIKSTTLLIVFADDKAMVLCSDSQERKMLLKACKNSARVQRFQLENRSQEAHWRSPKFHCIEGWLKVDVLPYNMRDDMYINFIGSHYGGLFESHLGIEKDGRHQIFIRVQGEANQFCPRKLVLDPATSKLREGNSNSISNVEGLIVAPPRPPNTWYGLDLQSKSINLGQESPTSMSKASDTGPSTNSMKIITISRGSKWRGRDRVEHRLKEKGRNQKDFAEGTVVSLENSNDQPSKGSLSLDIDQLNGRENQEMRKNMQSDNEAEDFIP
ncbi:hypothetical protein Sjap_004249 [Stephania japonica]|uniref:DUF4283 domain-containing protein n=1 Tax=Stephania japonica TaxID=461633 RepID=A0AAP0K1Y6_9MAGN